MTNMGYRESSKQNRNMNFIKPFLSVWFYFLFKKNCPLITKLLLNLHFMNKKPKNQKIKHKTGIIMVIF